MPSCNLSLKLTSGFDRSSLVAILTTPALAGADMRLLLHILTEFESMSPGNLSNPQDEKTSDENTSHHVKPERLAKRRGQLT